MKQLLENEQLRADLTRDILTDADLARLCATTTQTARRRRTAQQARVPILIALLIAAFALFPKTPQQTIATNPTSAPVPSTPTLAHTVIATQPFANIIQSEPAPTISTPQHLTYRILTDDELFQLLDGYAIAFHRTPSGRLQLEFLDDPQIQ